MNLYIKNFFKKKGEGVMEDKRLVAARILNELAEKKELLGTELFNAILRHFVPIAIEAVWLRKNSYQELEIFLRKRGPDEAYADQWHCPGSFMRYGEDEEATLARLAKKEFNSKFTKWYLCGEKFCFEKRSATILDRVYLVRCFNSKSEDGEWVAIRDLKKYNLVDSHRDFIIPLALKKAEEIGWI